MPTEQPSIEQRFDSLLQAEATPPEEELQETPPEPVEEETEVDAQAETEGESPEDAEPETAESEQFQSLSELAEALDMPIDDFMGTIKTKIKVSGQEHELTLAELQKGHQFEADYRQKTAQLAEERRQLSEQRQQLQDQYTQRLHEAGVIITELEKNLLDDFKDVNWNQLKAEDEQTYLLKRQDYNDRVQMINGVKAQASQKAQELMQEQGSFTEEQEKEYLVQQGTLLLQKLPEWQDGEKAKAEWSSIHSYLLQEGFSAQEASKLQDHRAIILARKAMLYDKGMQNIDVTKKKVKKLPKLQKPGARQSTSAAKGTLASQQRQKLKKSGDVRDAAKLIETLL